MADDYLTLEVYDFHPELSEKSNTLRIDLGESLGCEEMRPMMWFLEPGNDGKNYHSHQEQEEFYYVVSGPGRMIIAGETHTLPREPRSGFPPKLPGGRSPIPIASTGGWSSGRRTSRTPESSTKSDYGNGV